MYGSKETLDALDVTLDKTCQTAQVPGMALIVSQEGNTLFEKYYGYRNVERKLPVTANTIFGVASITKSFTALAIMQLEDAGLLTVGDRVSEWLPAFRLPEQIYTERITIHHLLTHTAGLPGLDAVHQARAESILHDPDGEYLFGEIPTSKQPVRTVTDVLETMAKTDYTLLGEPGEVFNYSNEGYAMLQEIIEKASGQPFITYVQSHILEPLQMEHSVLTMEALKSRENVTELYAYTQEKAKNVFHSPVWWDVGEIYANGSLKASASDLMKYLDIYRCDGFVRGRQIVSEKSIQKMITPHVTLPNGNQYGYGLQVQSQSGVTFVGHGGSIKGVSSNMQIVKDKGLTICVLTNLADVAAGDLVFTAVRHILDLQTEERLPDYPLTQGQLNKYTGHYESMEGHELDISVRDGQLQLDMAFDHIRMRPYRADGFVTPDGLKLVFHINAEGRVAGIFKGMRYIPKK